MNADLVRPRSTAALLVAVAAVVALVLGFAPTPAAAAPPVAVDDSATIDATPPVGPGSPFPAGSYPYSRIDVLENDMPSDGWTGSRIASVTPQTPGAPDLINDSGRQLVLAGPVDAATFSGEARWRYTACWPATGECADATLTVLFRPYAAPEPLRTAPDTLTVEAGGSASADVLSNDAPTAGAAFPAGAVTLTGYMAREGTATVTPDGIVTYTANAGTAATSDTQHYRVCDTTSACVTERIDITITRSPVVATDDHVELVYGQLPTTADVLGNDDFTGPATVAVVYDIEIDGVTYHRDGTGLTVNADQTISLDYDAWDAAGAGIAHHYQICASGQCDEARIHVQRTDRTEIVDDEATVMKGSTVIVDVVGNDHPAREVTVTAVTTADDYPVAASVTDDGQVSVTSRLGWFESRAELIYTVCDDRLQCWTGRIDVTITPEPHPVAETDRVLAVPGERLIVHPLANDPFRDEADPASLELLTVQGRGASQPEVGAGGSLTVELADDASWYTAVYLACAPDRALDSNDPRCATAWVWVLPTEAEFVTPETPPAGPPVAAPDVGEVGTDASVAIAVLTNDVFRRDMGGHRFAPVVDAWVTGDAGGVNVEVVGEEVVVTTTGATAPGSVELRYRLCDPVACSESDVEVAVRADPPIAVDDDFTFTDDDVYHAIYIDLPILDNDDLGGEPTSLTMINPPYGPGGPADVAAGGRYVELTSWTDGKEESFDYEVCTSGGGCDRATVTYVVNPTEEDPPVDPGGSENPPGPDDPDVPDGPDGPGGSEAPGPPDAGPGSSPPGDHEPAPDDLETVEAAPSSPGTLPVTGAGGAMALTVVGIGLLAAGALAATAAAEAAPSQPSGVADPGGSLPVAAAPPARYSIPAAGGAAVCHPTHRAASTALETGPWLLHPPPLDPPPDPAPQRVRIARDSGRSG